MVVSKLLNFTAVGKICILIDIIQTGSNQHLDEYWGFLTKLFYQCVLQDMFLVFQSANYPFKEANHLRHKYILCTPQTFSIAVKNYLDSQKKSSLPTITLKRGELLNFRGACIGCAFRSFWVKVKNQWAMYQGHINNTRWWFQIFFIFTLTGEMIKFEYFWDGLKPPTRILFFLQERFLFA